MAEIKGNSLDRYLILLRSNAIISSKTIFNQIPRLVFLRFATPAKIELQ